MDIAHKAAFIKPGSNRRNIVKAAYMYTFQDSVQEVQEP
jgi:hypothetical protein